MFADCFGNTRSQVISRNYIDLVYTGASAAQTEMDQI